MCECGCVPGKLDLWTLKLKFPMNLVCYEISYSSDLLQSFKNVETILSLQVRLGLWVIVLFILLFLGRYSASSILLVL